MNQPQNQNKTADGKSRAGEAGENLTDVLAATPIYALWDKSYYDSKSQMFPRDDQRYGRFSAVDENDLISQLTAAGLIVENCRWEIVAANDFN